MGINILKDTMVEMTWDEIESLAKEDAIVLFPVGVIEEHGHHLPHGTDIYIAYEQAHDVWKELSAMGVPSVIAPPFYWGGILALTRQFPGTFTCKRETIVTCITEILESLENAGFNKIVFFNDHGDRLHIDAILEAIRYTSENMKIRPYWMEYEDDMESHGWKGDEAYLLPLTPVKFEEMFECKQMPRDEFDVHAGAFETATMREICPEYVREDTLIDAEPTMLHNEQIRKWCEGKAEDRYLIANGYCGDPASSKYIISHLREIDKLLAKDIARALKA